MTTLPNQTKHALRVLLVRVRRQMEMQAFPLALCLRAKYKQALSEDISEQCLFLHDIKQSCEV